MTQSGDNQPLHLRSSRARPGKLDAGEAAQLLGELDDDWSLDDEAAVISRTYRFDNYYQTIAFVNALAWVAHQQDHHPDLAVGYNRCEVRFTTHSADGLSENDFICAARIDRLTAAGG